MMPLFDFNAAKLSAVTSGEIIAFVENYDHYAADVERLEQPRKDLALCLTPSMAMPLRIFSPGLHEITQWNEGLVRCSLDAEIARSEEKSTF